MSKLKELAEFLGCETKDIKQGYSENIFEYCNQEYLVLNDEEADKEAKNYILESVWAFNPNFIVENLNESFDHIKQEIMMDLIKLAQEKCEDGNEVIKAMIEEDTFIENAIESDGRGHFLSGYDGNENEQDEYFIYRTN